MPFFTFLDNEFAEIGRRTDESHGAQFSESRPQLGIGEAGIDLVVKPVDDLGGGVLRCADAVASALKIIARGPLRVLCHE